MGLEVTGFFFYCKLNFDVNLRIYQIVKTGIYLCSAIFFFQSKCFRDVEGLVLSFHYNQFPMDARLGCMEWRLEEELHQLSSLMINEW